VVGEFFGVSDLTVVKGTFVISKSGGQVQPRSSFFKTPARTLLVQIHSLIGPLSLLLKMVKALVMLSERKLRREGVG
jgi:hypothetical protein